MHFSSNTDRKKTIVATPSVTGTMYGVSLRLPFVIRWEVKVRVGWGCGVVWKVSRFLWLAGIRGGFVQKAAERSGASTGSGQGLA